MASRCVRGGLLGTCHGRPQARGSAPTVTRSRATSADTIGPATRITRVLAHVLTDAAAAGELHPPAPTLPGPRLVTTEVQEAYGPPPPYEDLIERALVLWISLIGSISFELSGHLHNTVTDYAAYFDAAVTITAQCAGLQVPGG
jgi:hypothetical protein